MPGTLTRSLSSLDSYSALRERVRETLLLGQERIEREKVRTYWETGRLINGYLEREIKSGHERAERHQEVVKRLARDLDLGEKVLYRCMRFAEAFPYFSARRSMEPTLTWSHCRALLAITDEKRRLALADRAACEEWGSHELELAVTRVNQANGRKPGPPELLKPLKGDFYTYRLIRPEKIHAGKPELRIDLGFSCQKEASMKGAQNLKAGDIATSKWMKGDTYRLKEAPGKTEADLFTYYAYIERVVDGDTLFVQVDLGFGCWTRQYLRLRGIDSPEIDTSEGKRAKKFVESELAGVPYVAIRSTRSDKYDPACRQAGATSPMFFTKPKMAKPSSITVCSKNVSPGGSEAFQSEKF